MGFLWGDGYLQNDRPTFTPMHRRIWAARFSQVCGNHDLPCDESWYREHWKDGDSRCYGPQPFMGTNAVPNHHLHGFYPDFFGQNSFC